ncbi:MAG: GTP-binding protein [Phycisphaerae bacterium]|nr:GTP-binding protein [Gemmatimonadaceae bacterium]
MIPLVLLAGFLGAGKTRFLTDVIPLLHARGVRVRVVLNDFENAEIDASRLASLNALVTPLNGECVCCISLRDLMDTLYAVPSDAGTVMLIEANGATETDELLGFLTMDSKLSQYTPPLQLTVLDTGRWQKRWFHNALERAQATTATHLHMNWTEKLSAERLRKTEASVREINPRGALTTPALFADEMAALVEAVRDKPARASLRSEPPVHTHVHGNTELPHLHTGKSHVHPFASTAMALPALVERESFQRFVQLLPAQVVRAKGQVRFSDRPDKMFVWNKVDGRNGVHLDECTPHAHTRPVALFVGVHLPLNELTAAIDGITTAASP